MVKMVNFMLCIFYNNKNNKTTKEIISAFKEILFFNFLNFFIVAQVQLSPFSPHQSPHSPPPHDMRTAMTVINHTSDAGEGLRWLL